MLSLRRLARGELAVAGRDRLLGVLDGIERLANQLAGYRVEVLDALEALSGSGAAPDASPHLSLRDAAGVSEREARHMVRVADKVRSNERVLAALSDGHVTPTQAEALCDARVPDEVRVELTDSAGSEGTDETRRRIRQAEAMHSVETSMERFERQRKARGAGWRRDHEGMLRLWAKFDPDTGAHIEAALEALRRQFWNDDKQVRTERRTPAQRDADALAYALAGLTCTDADAAAVDRMHARARRRGHSPDRQPASQRFTPPKHAAADGTDDRQSDRHPVDDLGLGVSGQHATAGGERPDRRAGQAAPIPRETGPESDSPQRRGHHVNCRVPVPSEAGWEGDSGDPAWRLPPAQISVLIDLDALRGRTDEMGLTDAGTELPPEVVRRLACDAEIIPMILNSKGGPADVGRCSRTVPLRLRRLLIARDRHCQWPGCCAPPSRCDAHHIIHWLDGGPTNLDNLVLLCHTHHRHLHQHGYRMVPQPDGTWTTAQETEPTPTARRGKAQARAP